VQCWELREEGLKETLEGAGLEDWKNCWKGIRLTALSLSLSLSLSFPFLLSSLAVGVKQGG